ncbi:hypothetical protein, partial [Bacillus pumilus]
MVWIDMGDVDMGKKMGGIVQREEGEGDKKIGEGKGEERRGMGVGE